MVAFGLLDVFQPGLIKPYVVTVPGTVRLVFCGVLVIFLHLHYTDCPVCFMKHWSSNVLDFVFLFVLLLYPLKPAIAVLFDPSVNLSVTALMPLFHVIQGVYKLIWCYDRSIGCSSRN